MNVWVVTKEYATEGDSVLGVAKDPDKGRELAEEHMNTTEKPRGQWNYIATVARWERQVSGNATYAVERMRVRGTQ